VSSSGSAIAVTDEIYDAHPLRRRRAHLDGGLDGMADRTITINSVSKTFSVTGWRVGWANRAAGHHRRDQKSARLSHRRRRRAAAGGRRRRAGIAASYYTDLAATYSQKAAID
jgi:aspartate/methionine/tyrosine aminotransferase